MNGWLRLFWMFIKVNLLTTSGPASVGLLYKEAVPSLLSEGEFVEAVGFSSVLPGSDALQLAMFVGYAARGVPGALTALLGSILPPTVLMLGVITILQRLRGEAWVGNFVRGLAPAVAALMALVAWQVFRGEGGGRVQISIIIAVSSIAALLMKAPSALVLLAAGIAGMVFFR
ncbi:MAG: chromate transporter [Chloroflexi bacterium]|nr:chromate transporter [Chloroflexota bacterium]